MSVSMHRINVNQAPLVFSGVFGVELCKIKTKSKPK